MTERSGTYRGKNCIRLGVPRAGLSTWSPPPPYLSNNPDSEGATERDVALPTIRDLLRDNSACETPMSASRGDEAHMDGLRAICLLRDQRRPESEMRARIFKTARALTRWLKRGKGRLPD